MELAEKTIESRVTHLEDTMNDFEGVFSRIHDLESSLKSVHGSEAQRMADTQDMIEARFAYQRYEIVKKVKDVAWWFADTAAIVTLAAGAAFVAVEVDRSRRPEVIDNSTIGAFSWAERPAKGTCHVFDIYDGKKRVSVINVPAGCKP